MPKKKLPAPPPDRSHDEHTDLDRDIHHAIRDLHRLQGELIMIAQSILDAQTRLDTAVKAVDTKVTDLLGRPVADPTAATAAEQETIAAGIVSAAAAVEATNAKV